MQKPDHHIFVCASFRTSGEPQGVCHRKGAGDLMGCLEEEIADRGIDAMVSSTGCMKLCEKGPVMVVYPEGHWYGKMTEEKIETILDALEEGQAAEALLIG